MKLALIGAAAVAAAAFATPAMAQAVIEDPGFCAGFAYADELRVWQADGDQTFMDPELNVDQYWYDGAEMDNSELLQEVFLPPSATRAYYHKMLGRTGSGVEGLGPPGGGRGFGGGSGGGGARGAALNWEHCTGAMISRIQHPGWVQTLVPGWYRNPHYVGRNHGQECARVN